ncbi:hypothetical protein [Pandoraea commovens]|uniref:Uncharacterized protein n=1 Tax=Pandoraea commovens TaxID=2508289 RepID=A0A5E4Y611_9BURK|nr:hypothetical protein [Pandoraea commovens]UVA78199.1 hypothetical protein NTU39_19275 [Pandoraea commovens]VVE43818.1 hypothetical protein PCO31010_04302 [Pandoraea commovens]
MTRLFRWLTRVGYVLTLWLAVGAAHALAPDDIGTLSDTAAIDAAEAAQMSGADTARLINARYAKTVPRCFGESPTYECSGLLLRVAPPNGVGNTFWRQSPAETAAGYAELTYVRRDTPAARPPASVGFVLADRPTAAGNEKPYSLMCGCPPYGQTLPTCAACARSPNAVGVSLWNVNTPATLDVEAIYFDVSAGGQLMQALRYQNDYFAATGQWVPILRASLAGGEGTAFGFDERDQLMWGFTVVKDLEARYADTRMVCPGNTPGYQCSGVLFRVTGYSAGARAWNPSAAGARDGALSWSYARRDMNMTNALYADAGMLLHELRYPSTYTPQWRCAYARDAGTAGTPGRCSLPGAMPASVAGFQALVTARQSIRGTHNEIILASWPLNIPNDLPLQAFFYQFDTLRTNAQSIQQDYMGRTGHFMPVVAMRLPMAPGSVFRYVPSEQTGAMSTTAVGN